MTYPAHDPTDTGTHNVQYETPPQLGSGHAMAPPAYPYPYPYYRNIFVPCYAQLYPPQLYGGHPMVHFQLMGVQQAGVPLPTGVAEKPVFVNAKQYHGILRRRQSRAKAELKNKASRNKKIIIKGKNVPESCVVSCKPLDVNIDLPYLHESRHKARGCGGRFLNSKKSENEQEEVASTDKSQSNINLNSDKNDLAPSDKTS
ncbi:hypothetical protein SESBI_14051 [Sesbania bispinosa]|nr:hypothetical protein SESBI_14051 [Sesbania bispinosa]